MRRVAVASTLNSDMAARLRSGLRSVRRRTIPAWQIPWDESRPLTQPTLHPGHQIGPPSFVGIGAQKAGTSWWYKLIVDHPGVYEAERAHKERHFFDRTGLSDFGDDECEQYARLFPRPEGMLVGEWTPRYMHLPWTASQLSRAAPNTRVLVVLRDPIDRLVSGLAHELQRQRSITAEAVNGAIGRGLYGAQLRTATASIPFDQILILQYERLISDPESQLARTYEFLGLDQGHVPDSLHRSVSGTLVAKPDVPAGLGAMLREIYDDDFDVLDILFPGAIDRDLWPNLRRPGPK